MVVGAVAVVVALAGIGLGWWSGHPSKSGGSSSGSTASPQQAADRAAQAAGCPSDPKTALHKPSWTKPPAMTIDMAKSYTATVKTDVGSFTITLDPQAAPQTVNNFVFLAQQGFYNCVTFHRVIPGFMDQTGDPTGTGTGGPGYTIPDEFPKAAANSSQQYPLGGVAMANTGSPNSGGSQFFVITGPEGESLGPQYTLFGTVTSGMDVVQKIAADGNADPNANGEPPKVLHRMLQVTIATS